MYIFYKYIHTYTYIKIYWVCPTTCNIGKEANHYFRERHATEPSSTVTDSRIDPMYIYIVFILQSYRACLGITNLYSGVQKDLAEGVSMMSNGLMNL